MRDQDAADPVDRGRHHGEARLDRGHHPAAGHPLAHLEVREPQRVRLEPVRELVAAAHRLAQQDPRDRQRLLYEARDVGERLLRPLRDPATLLPDTTREEGEQRDQREGEQRELPAQEEHADHRRHDRGHVRGDRGRRVRDNVLHAADVVGDPRLHLAGARAREEGKRQALQVAEDRGAQVVHHSLADLVREQRLKDAEHAGHDRDRDHPEGVPRERAGVVPPDRLQHALEQEGRDHAEPRRDHDQQEDAAEPHLVGREERADAAQVRTTHGWIGSAIRRCLGRVEEHAHQPRVRAAAYMPMAW